MTTLRSLIIKYKDFAKSILPNNYELEKLLEIPLGSSVSEANSNNVNENDFYISYLGPVGITLMSKEGPISSIRKITEILDLHIDIENWQEETLPFIFKKYTTNEQVILSMIFKELGMIDIRNPNDTDLQTSVSKANLSPTDPKDIFVVNGCIDDGMRGIPFILGYFDSFNLAEKQLLDFIEKLNFEKTVEKSGNHYSISSFKMFFNIGIETQQINKIYIPDDFVKYFKQ